MKKLIMFALTAIICGSASAQIVSSTTKEISTKAPSNKVHYLQASLGFLSVTGDGVKDVESASGFDFLYGYEKPLGEDGVFWGQEIGIGTSRGYKTSYKESGFSMENSLRTYSVRYMPLNFGYRYSNETGLAIEGHVGCGVSVDFAGGFTYKVNDKSETSSIWDLGEDGGEDGWMPADVYLKVGGSVSYNNIGIDLSWQKGFLEPIKDCKWTSSNIFLGVRYLF